MKGTSRGRCDAGGRVDGGRVLLRTSMKGTSRGRCDSGGPRRLRCAGANLIEGHLPREVRLEDPRHTAGFPAQPTSMKGTSRGRCDLGIVTERDYDVTAPQ